MKAKFFLVIFALSFGFVSQSCSGEPDTPSNTDEEVKEETSSQETLNKLDVTLSNIAGIWEIVENRENPDEKGKKVGMMDKGILFGFTEGGLMSTTSLGLEFMKESLNDSPIMITIKDDQICSADDNEMFEMQWKGCIKVAFVTDDQLCLSSNSALWGNKFKLLKRVE